jgi:hypothetical protein
MSKIPVLDGGYVRLISCSPPFEEYRKILASHFRNNLTWSILDISSITLEIKCPYFILIPLVSSGMKAVAYPRQPDEAFTPSIDYIKSGSLENDKDISESMKMTIDSLMLNKRAYMHDGCDPFISSITTPVSCFWEGIIYAKTVDWVRFISSKNLHTVVNLYQKSIENAISTEYKNIEDIKKWLKK